MRNRGKGEAVDAAADRDSDLANGSQDGTQPL
jgi:hypothetical protein